MMVAHALRQMAGVWGMAWNRPHWERQLDRSIDGVFRSFWSIAFAAPLMGVAFLALRAAAKNGAVEDELVSAPVSVWLGANFAAFAVDWAVGLAALLFAARLLGADKRAGDAVIGYNWAQTIVAAAQALPFGLLGFLGSRTGFSLFFFPALIIAGALSYGVQRRGLGLPVGASIALTIALMLIAALVSALTHAGAVALYRLGS